MEATTFRHIEITNHARLRGISRGSNKTAIAASESGLVNRFANAVKKAEFFNLGKGGKYIIKEAGVVFVFAPKGVDLAVLISVWEKK